MGLNMTMLVFFSTLKMIRTDFPILCPGTSDPFKNKIVLRPFSAHVHVIVWAFKINLGKIRNYAVKSSKMSLCGSKHDDIGVFFNIQKHSQWLSYSLPGYFRPI